MRNEIGDEKKDGNAKHEHADCHHYFMCNLSPVDMQLLAPHSNWQAEVLEVDLPAHAMGASFFFYW